MPLSLSNGNINFSAFFREELRWPPLPLPGCVRERLKCVAARMWVCVCVCVFIKCCCYTIWLCDVYRLWMQIYKPRGGYKRELFWSGWIVWEFGSGDGGGVTSVVFERLWVRLQQWGSNRGHEWECLFMWVSGLPFNPFSLFSCLLHRK